MAHPFARPRGAQVIDVSLPCAVLPLRRLCDHGHGSMASKWNDVIGIASKGWAARYADRFESAAGWRTALVVATARLFNAGRLRRWHRLSRISTAPTRHSGKPGLNARFFD